MKKLGFLAAAFFFAAAAFGQSISAPDAMQRALALTGGGNVSNLELVTEGGAPVYRIVIVNNGVNFAVSINGNTGAVMSLVSGQPQTAPQTAQQGGIPIPANVVPRPPARSGGPANPPISAQRAVELSRAHLIAIGVTNARFDYVYMDIERGVWVWSVEFDGPGRSFEFYVNVQTGAFLQAP